jgi:hypothetical protein
VCWRIKEQIIRSPAADAASESESCFGEFRRIMSILAQTLQLAFRIAIVWAGGFLLAVAVRAMLPDQSGLTFPGSQGALFIPYSRVGFWTCLLAAVTVTALVVVRAMLTDFGLRS